MKDSLAEAIYIAGEWVVRVLDGLFWPRRLGGSFAEIPINRPRFLSRTLLSSTAVISRLMRKQRLPAREKGFFYM